MGSMAGCCSSRKGKEHDYDADINSMTIDDLNSHGGVFGQQEPEAMSFKYQDDMMDKYIQENLIDVELKEVGGLLDFESFLKVYKTALIWNRVKFRKQKL